MRTVVELFRSPDGRLEGELRAPDGTGGTFEGILALLRVLERLDLAPRPGDRATAAQRVLGRGRLSRPTVAVAGGAGGDRLRAALTGLSTVAFAVLVRAGLTFVLRRQRPPAGHS